jgi:tyrosine-protein kinase Etk/Wzc
MISSASPGAGKSFVASNLAVVMAQAGQRVLLIDADMRKGLLHRMIGGRPDNGLSELIAGQAQLSDVIRPVNGVSNLMFIPRGKIPPNPSELLMHANFNSLLDAVRFGINQVREIALAKQRLEQNGVPIKGAIFNLVEKRAAGYYAYAYYAYAPTSKA